jgi:hypothetical protein
MHVGEDVDTVRGRCGVIGKVPTSDCSESERANSVHAVEGNRKRCRQVFLLRASAVLLKERELTEGKRVSGSW